MLRRKLSTNKKGSADDLLIIIMVLFAFAVITLIGYVFISRFNDQIQANPNMPNASKDAVDRVENIFPQVIDKGFVFFAICLGLAALVLAALVRIHPFFIFFFIIT